MARTRLSTTVDADLLERARRVRSGVTDATLIEEALAALLLRHRAAEVDASYAAYDEHPLDEPTRPSWPIPACGRSAAPSKSRSTAKADIAAVMTAQRFVATVERLAS